MPPTPRSVNSCVAAATISRRGSAAGRRAARCGAGDRYGASVGFTGGDHARKVARVRNGRVNSVAAPLTRGTVRPAHWAPTFSTPSKPREIRGRRAARHQHHRRRPRPRAGPGRAPGRRTSRPCPQPTPPASSTVPEHRSPPRRMLWDDVIAPGGDSSRVLPRGAVVRLTDLEGDACANVLVYNAAQPMERLNVADTVKVQWQAYLGAGLAAPLRHGPRAAHRRRRHQRRATTRSAARRTGSATRRSTATAPSTARTRTPATGSRSRWPSTGSAAATSCPTSTSSRARVVAPDGALRVRRPRRGRRVRTSSCGPSCR